MYTFYFPVKVKKHKKGLANAVEHKYKNKDRPPIIMVKLIDQLKDKQRSILDALNVKKTESEEATALVVANGVASASASGTTLKKSTVSFAPPSDRNLLNPDGDNRDNGKIYFSNYLKNA